MSTYFTPVDAGGMARFTQGAEPAGWYQLDLPGAILDTVPGITVPAGTTGVLIQAHTALEICRSPWAADAGAPRGILLPAGSNVFIPGQVAVAQLCFLFTASGVDFSLQFYTGDIGPTITIN